MPPETYTQPPVYTAIMVTNFFAIACGLIFKDMLEYEVDLWAANRQTQETIKYRHPSLIFAYANLCLFVWLFMGFSFMVFNLSPTLALGLAALVVLPTGGLIWLQLGSMLSLLVRGGSAAIDISAYETNYQPAEPSEPQES